LRQGIPHPLKNPLILSQRILLDCKWKNRLALQFSVKTCGTNRLSDSTLALPVLISFKILLENEFSNLPENNLKINFGVGKTASDQVVRADTCIMSAKTPDCNGFFLPNAASPRAAYQPAFGEKLVEAPSFLDT
jgi:hypothetical protein